MSCIKLRCLVALLSVCVLFSHAPVWGQSRVEDDSEMLETTATPRTTSVATEQASDIIVTKSNSFRQEHGTKPVKVNSKLVETAQYFASYMARTDNYGHRADGKRPSERAQAHGYNYCLVAENIAYQFSSAGFKTEELANRFVEGWKTSPPHRENMLDADVRETGVAIARGERTGYWYAVQLFGRPKSAALEFKIANESDATIQYSIKDRSFELPPG